MTILNHGRADKPFRPVQVEALEWFEKNYDSHDVLVIEGPTAVGKSVIVTTIANWLESRDMYGQESAKVSVCTPTKILQDQYMTDFGDIPVLKGQASYPCDLAEGATCQKTKRSLGSCCKPTEENGRAVCNYLIARQEALDAPIALFNLHSYYANKMYKDALIIDESHNALKFLFDYYSLKFWKCEVDYTDDAPMNVETVKDLINKAKCDLQLHLVTLQDQGGDTKSLGNIEDEIERLTLIATTIEFYEKDLLICKVEEEYYGKVKELRKTKQEHIYVKPTVVDRIGIQTLWPKKIKKVILLSATINEEDIKRLGLQDRRVAYLRLDSPIPPERRPFVYTPVASMAYRNRKESIPAIIKMCGQIAAKMDKHKGVIHCTYDMADKLKAEYRYNDRFWFHGKMDKSDRYNEFRAAKGNMIFVASGMSEGIDLAGDSARFQIITQLMRPNLGDRVNAWMVKNNINAYNWEAVREVIQQAGRICRGPEDFGMTFMLDSEFQGFYNQTSHLWPQWFKKAIVWPKG